MVDVRALDAWNKLKENDNSLIIDVRCNYEIKKFGSPNLSSLNRKIVNIPWVDELTMSLNNEFINNLCSNNINSNMFLFFICAAGVRSHYAVELARNNGYKNSYNISGGMNNKSGWINSKLPYIKEVI